MSFRLQLLALSLLLTSSLPLTGLAAEKVQAPKKLFLSIGIGSYDDKRWPSLGYSGKDAEDVAAALRSGFDGGQLLSDRERQGGVRKADILMALSQLQAQNSSEDDTVVVYISTHGTLAQGLEGGTRKIQKYLVTQDTIYDQIAESGLNFKDLIQRFQALKSRRKALIVDSCYSGVGKAHITPAMLAFMAKQKSGALQQPVDPIDESTGVYTASAWGEEAHEDPKLGNGVYTHFLIKAFDEDLNGDGAVQLSEAHQAASNAVITYTRGAQHPTAQVEIVGRDPIILRGKTGKQASPSLLTWRWDMRQYLVKFRGKTFGTLAKGIVSVPEGEGILQLIDPKTDKVIASRRVELAQNEIYSIEKFLYDVEPHRLSLGTLFTRFIGRDAQQRISKDPLPWWEGSYVYDDAIGPLDLGVNLAFLPKQDGSVQLDEALAGQSLGRQREKQSLWGWKADLKIQRRQRLDILSSFDRRWVTRSFGAIGVSTLQLERRFSELRNTPEAESQASSVGLMGESGLELRSQTYRVWSQAKLQLASYDNQFTESSGQVNLWGFALAVGVYW